MIEELRTSCPEQTASGVVLFPEVLNEFPPRLADAHVAVLESVQKGYRKQREIRVYPPMTEEEWQEAVSRNPQVAANNTLVQRNRWNKRIEPLSYKDSSFKGIFDEIADGLRGVRRIAASLGLPDASLIERQTQFLETGFRSGDTDRAMEEYLNLRRHPKFGIWCGFLDRLDDKERALKFSLQAWSNVQNEALSQDFNTWSRIVLRGRGRFTYSDFLVADAAGMAGLAAVRIWQGNTQPSQPEIGESYGHLINSFDNVSAWKTAKDIEPVLKEITPSEVLERVIRREVLTKARRAIIAGHEVGHAAHVIPKNTDLRLGRWYQVIREMYAEAFALWSVIKYPEIIISRGQVPAAIYFALALSESTIEKYIEEKESGSVDSDRTDPYPYSSAGLINTLLAARVIERSSDGIYEFNMSDLNPIRDAADSYLQELTRLTNISSLTETEDFIMDRVSKPLDFLRVQSS